MNPTTTGERITIASLNTQMGKAIREPGGLKPLDGIDILLMQEVVMDSGYLAERVIAEIGLGIGQFDAELGLAIAIGSRHSITGHHKQILQSRGAFGRMMLDYQDRFQGAKFRLRGRGLLGLTLKTPVDNQLSVITAHPTVQLKMLSRNIQIRGLADAINEIEDPLVFAADMNHWPGPHKVDHEMIEATDLGSVELADTFDVERTRYAWLGKLAWAGLKVNGQLDAMMYRGDGLEHVGTSLVDEPSDHRAVVSTFTIQNQIQH